MSALAKPMVHSTRAIGTVQPINAESIINFNKLDVPPRANATATRYEITITYSTGTAPKDLKWVYANETDRNTDFDALVALISTVIP